MFNHFKGFKKRHFNIIVFLVLVMGFGIIGLFTPKSEAYIASENRMSQTLPPLTKDSLFSGNYFGAFDQFYSDHFVMRSKWVALSQVVKKYEGIPSKDNVALIDFAGANVAGEIDETHTSGEAASKDQLESDSKGQSLELQNWGKLLAYEDKVMEINQINEAAIEHYTSVINNYADRYKDIQVSVLMPPTQIEFLEDEDYKSLSDSERESLDLVKKGLSDKVDFVDVYDSLKAHQDDYIYFRTDHHWTQRGAFYAYQVLSQHLGVTPKTLSDFKIDAYPGYLGSLYNASQLEVLKDNPDVVEVFRGLPHNQMMSLQGDTYDKDGDVYIESYLTDSQMYGIFCGGDRAIYKIETQNHSGRKILVLKDSYANALIPFLTELADEILVIDPRMYDENIDSLVSDEGITDILFINYVLVNRWDGYGGLYEKLIQ